MKCFVSYSGGLGSFVSAHFAKEEFDDVELLFCDTLIEDEDLYRFLKESSEKLDLKLTTLCEGRNPWEVFTDIGFQGNSRIAPCSKVLKTDVVKKHLKQFKEPITLILGMNFDEEDRYVRAKANWAKINKNVTIYCPLIENKVDEVKKNEILKSYDIKRPRLYDLGFAHNNCGGFCVRAGLSQFKLLKRTFPERFKWHKEQQNKLHKDKPKANKPFLRKTENGVLSYISLEEFEEMKNVPEFDFGGCGCFIDDEL